MMIRVPPLLNKWLLFSLVALLFFPLQGRGHSFDALLDQLSKSDDSQPKQEEPKEALNSTSQTIDEEFSPAKNIQTNGVTLQGLDKAIARVFIIDAKIGQTIEFGTLRIHVHHCEKAAPEERQESIAYLTIEEVKPQQPAHKIFSGWMFASSPALSALDHPVYDVWVKECKELAPTPPKP